MRIVFILLVLFSSLYSIEVDMDLLKKEVSSNPHEVNARLILSRFYIGKSSYDEAQNLLDEVLKEDSKNQKALFLLKDIKKLKQIESLVKSGKLSQSSKLSLYFDKLLSQKHYKYATLLYEVLNRNNINLSSDVVANTVDSYIHTHEFKKAQRVLENSTLSAQDKAFFSAKIYDKKGQNLESENSYKSALKIGDREDIVLGLYELYIKQNKIKEAKELVNSYETKGAENPILKALQKEDKQYMHKQIMASKENYLKDSSFENFQKYYYLLSDNGDKQEALSLSKEYVKAHPTDEAGVLFLAKLQNWNHQPMQSIKTLKPLVAKSDNKEILALYADVLNQTGKKSEALVYMKKLATLGDENSKVEIAKFELNSLLDRAVAAHRAKDYTKAIKNYKAYYGQTKDSKIAKEIAELYFVQGEALESLGFYRAYLADKPNDSKIRFRYAAALDSLKEYEKAEQEYLKVSKNRDELYTLSTYRYASSLIAQKDEAKWNYARGVLESLLDTLEGQTPSKQREELMSFTTATLQKVSKPMPKPTRYKDVILAEGQKKLINSQEIFLDSKLLRRSIFSTKSMLMPISLPAKTDTRKDVTLSLYMLQDDTIDNFESSIRLNRIVKIANGTLSLDMKKSRFKKDTVKHDVDSFLAYFNFKNLSVGMGLSKFEEFNDVIAQMTYRKIFPGHDMTFGLKNINGAFVNSQACMIDEKINALQFSLYDAMLLSSLEQFELGLTLNRYDDENINLNSWLEYPLYKTTYSNFENAFVLSGSYEFNTKTVGCYYPTKFYDGNYIQTKPKFSFGKNGYVQGIGGVGYSFKNDDFLYNYGLNAKFFIDNSFEIGVDCRHYQSGYSPDGADECYATASYIW